jgi:hypothetical protein
MAHRLQHQKAGPLTKKSLLPAPPPRASNGQRERVADKCPLVETGNVWLPKMVWICHCPNCRNCHCRAEARKV